ncbi:MAG TPA: heparinase II/III family protein [Candidatus Aminicenantes bacterium]|nr:heparinase II/III family protein [Candidatus Aminicenantes bacterium]HRY65825.1 heparinase II/III family protein [Candidatus Aminicenantes bacterium]HRZ72849.1 heparinase II/III family protein [Candidatus Aminicenantes bacterium]
MNRKRAVLGLAAVCLSSVLFAAGTKPALEPYSYKEDFESNELNAWAPYPLSQDTAFDPNFHPGRLVAGDPNISLIQRVTPHSPFEAYAGAQKVLDAWLVPGSRVGFRYYLKTELAAEYLRVRLAAGEAGAVDLTLPAPRTNAWQTVTATYEDILRQNPRLEGKEIKVNALAVLVKFPQADPDMPIILGLDDILFSAARGARFVFAEPRMHELAEWRPRIPDQPYHRGDTLRLRGRWPFRADRVEIRIEDFPARKKVFYDGRMAPQAGEWQARIGLAWPEGLYIGRLTARSGRETLAETEFTVHVALPASRLVHPRLWWTPATVAALRARLAESRFDGVRQEIARDLARSREKLPPEKIVFDIDRFPRNEALIGNLPRSISAWGGRIDDWSTALRSSSLSYALLGDPAAGAYGKAVLLKLCAFPFWLHPWFENRGQHTYYPVGELAIDVALAYDLLHGLMSEAERQSCREALFRNHIEGTHRSYVEDNLVTNDTSNWVAHVCCGSLLAQAAVFGDGPEAGVREPYFTGAVLKLEDFIRRSAGRDGGYGESFAYCGFTMLSLSSALPALESVFGLDLAGPLALNHLDMIWAGLIKDRLFFQFGDSTGALTPLTSWAWFLPKARDPQLTWLYRFLKKGETFSDVLYPTEAGPARDPFDQAPVRLFRDLGTAVFKSGWEKDDFVFVLRTGAFYNHQHLDQGTFWLADRGSLFIEERQGSSYYDDPFYPSHYIQPVAHSTILIDRNPQSQRAGDPLGFAPGFEDRAAVGHFLDGTDAAFVSGDIGRLYWGKVRELRRNVLYLKPRTVLMIDTVVPAEKDVDVTLLFQTARFGDIRPDAALSRIIRDGRALGIAHLAPAAVEVAAERTPIYIKTLNAENPLTEQGLLSVTARTKGRPLVLANLLEVGEPDGRTSPGRTGQGCVAGAAGGREFAFSTEPGRPFEAGGFTTDALALTWGGDLVFAAMARTLDRGGERLLASTEPVTCELGPRRMKYCLAAPAVVTLRAASRPAAVLVNGRSRRGWAYDPAAGSLTLALEAGEGTVTY